MLVHVDSCYDYGHGTVHDYCVCMVIVQNAKDSGLLVIEVFFPTNVFFSLWGLSAMTPANLLNCNLLAPVCAMGILGRWMFERSYNLDV